MRSTSGRTAVFAFTIAAVVAGCRSEPPPPDVPRLVADLQSPDAALAGKARLALIEVGDPAVAPITELLRSPDARIRLAGATALWGLGVKSAPAAGELGRLLSDADPGVRLTSAMALEAIGPGAAPAVAALAQALRKDPDNQVRQWSAKALGSIGPAAKPALGALQEAALHEGLRPSAEEAMKKIGGV